MERRMSRAEIMQFIEEDLKQFDAEVEAHPERYDPEWIEARKQARRASGLLAQRLWEQARVRIESIDDFSSKGLPREEYLRAIPVLLEALEDPEMEPIWDGIIWALGVKIARNLTVQPLIEAFKRFSAPRSDSEVQSKDEARRLYCKWSMGHILGRLADRSKVDQIIELLLDASHGVAREGLIEVLVRLKPERSVEILLQLLQDETVALQAIRALGRLRVREAIPYIQPFLQHPNPLIRRVAKDALKRIES